MRHCLAAVALAVASTALPSTAHADILLTPYAGTNFGGSTVDARLNFGGSLMVVGRVFGVELDGAFIPDFFAPRDLDIDVLGTNNVTTVMGNLVFGRFGGGLQPYAAAGAGLVRTQVTDFGEFFDAAESSLGVNAGGGLLVGGGRFSLRGDVRYFRNVTGTDEPLLEETLGDFGFWRATAGLTIRF